MATATFEPGKRPTSSSETPGSATSTTSTRHIQDTAQEAMERVGGAAQAVADQGRQAADNIREVTDTFANAIEESLEKRPMTTLAMAVGVGFFLGALWQR